MIHNLNPKIWGKDCWNTIYYIAFSYPSNPSDNDKQTYRFFYLYLFKVLPCESCREHCNDIIIQYPLNDFVLSSRDNLLKWLLNINNNVNRRLNKKDISFNELIDKYSIYYDAGTHDVDTFNDKKKYFKTLLTIIILLLAIVCIIFILLCS